MKKIILYINILIMGVLAAVSCDLNHYPVFDDNDAFVAFDATSYQFNEPSSGTVIVEVSVTLASVEGINTSVSYEALDGTAIAGDDYDLVDPTGVLTFDSENRTRTIQIVLYDNYAGTYTGNKKFTLQFKSTGNVNPGAENTTTVTIADIDHPLNAILGTYTMTGVSYFNGNVTWPLTLERDESDVTVVWLSGLTQGQSIGGFYGTVTMDEDGVTPKSISIQLGQQSTKTTSTCLLYGCDTEGEYIYSSGVMEVAITNGGKNIAFTELGPALNANGANSYYDIILGGATGVKQ